MQDINEKKEIGISELFCKLELIIEDNNDNFDFLKRLLKSRINFGQNRYNKNIIIKDLDLFRQALTFGFFNYSEYWTDSYYLYGLEGRDLELCKLDKKEYIFESGGALSRSLLKKKDFELKRKILNKLSLEDLSNLVSTHFELIEKKEKENNFFEWKEDYKKTFSVSFCFFILKYTSDIIKNGDIPKRLKGLVSKTNR